MIQRIRTLLATLGPSASMLGFAGSTLIKALGGLFIIKIIALKLGPTSFGQLGQLMTLVAITSNFAGGGVGNALIQALSANPDMAVRQRKLGAAFKIFGATSAFMMIALLLFSHSLSFYILDRPDMGWVFVTLAGTQWLVGISNTLLSVLSALKKVRTIVVVNSIGTILATGLFVTLLLNGHFEGAALGFVLYPAVTGLIGLIVWLTRLPPDWRKPLWLTHQSDLKQLLSYSVVMVVTVSAVPFGQIVVRDYFGAHEGWQYVGYWQGVMKVSDVYMQFISLCLSYYALPRFSAHRDKQDLSHEFSRILKLLLAMMFVGTASLYVLRDFAIRVLFSADFAPMRDYFLPQMLGDFMRVAASVFIFYGLSRGARMMPIVFEIMQACGLMAFTFLLTPVLHQVAPVWAFMITCGFSLLLMIGMRQRGKRKWFPSGNA